MSKKLHSGETAAPAGGGGQTKAVNHPVCRLAHAKEPMSASYWALAASAVASAAAADDGSATVTSVALVLLLAATEMVRPLEERAADAPPPPCNSEVRCMNCTWPMRICSGTRDGTRWQRHAKKKKKKKGGRGK